MEHVAALKASLAPDGAQLDYGGGAGPVVVTKGNRKILISPRNWVYTWDLCSQFEVFFETVVPDVSGGFEIVDFSQPKVHVLRETGQRLHFTSFAEDISSTRLYLEFFQLQEGDIVIDLGSYCGLSVLTFSQAVGPTGKVFAFEADPRNYASLMRNLTENAAANVVAAHKAVCGRAGRVSFSSEANMGSAVIPDASRNRDVLVEVDATTLAEIVARHGLGRVAAVKMDIEGSEYGVIEASEDVIGSMKARWMIEVHGDDWPGGRVDVERLRKVFERNDHVTLLKKANEATVFGMLFACPREYLGRVPAPSRADGV